MKKHKFKVGDVVYLIFSDAYHKVKVQKRFYVKDGNAGWPCLHLAETLESCLGGWGSKYPTKDCHPTPEACAQALVDEFYLNNPKN